MEGLEDRAGERVAGYSVGPFRVDLRAQTITLNPGVYTLHRPVTFLYDETARIEGFHYRPLREGGPDSDKGSTEGMTIRGCTFVGEQQGIYSD